MIGRMMMLDGAAFHDYLQSPNIDKISRLLLITVGVLYGLISMISNWTYVSSFESQVLKLFIVPAIFIIFGLLTALITRLGLSLLLWASSKGFGGKGLLGQVNKAASVSLVPGISSVPFLTGNGNAAVLALLTAGLIWMYLISVQVVRATQGFDAKKAYLASLLSFVFLASIYYIIVPA